MQQNNHSREELAAMLTATQAATDRFYSMARPIGCHQFIEFAGLMTEYVNLCREALERNIDFTTTSIHGRGAPLPMKSVQRDYLDEKLQCIYGVSLDALMTKDQRR